MSAKDRTHSRGETTKESSEKWTDNEGDRWSELHSSSSSVASEASRTSTAPSKTSNAIKSLKEELEAEEIKQVGSAAESDTASDSASEDSIETIRPARLHSVDIATSKLEASKSEEQTQPSVQESNAGQMILSADCLQRQSSFQQQQQQRQHSKEELTLIEVDLNEQVRDSVEMFSPSYRYCDESNVSERFNTQTNSYGNYNPRSFGEAPAKVCFASKRVKEYFESFKSHSAEKGRLYQFFKSTRSELAACLLFCLILSQCLIVCRTSLEQTGWQNLATNKQQDAANNHQVVVVHVISGLVAAFAVATLTQVFGHISGCHLIPSVSLALYVKGHISRARLASYLFAQSVGALLAVLLLALLTGSQVAPGALKLALEASNPSTTFAGLSYGPSPADAKNADTPRARKRRQVSSSGPAQQPDALIGLLNDTQASETIWLSIMSEQERQLEALRKRKQQQQQQQQEEHLSSSNITQLKPLEWATNGTIKADNSTAVLSGGPLRPPAHGLSRNAGQTPVETRDPEPNNTSSSDINPGEAGQHATRQQAALIQTVISSSPIIDDKQQLAAAAAASPLIDRASVQHENNQTSVHLSSPDAQPPSTSTASSTSQRTRRKKRQRQQARPVNANANANANASETNHHGHKLTERINSNEQAAPDDVGQQQYINLLEFALPDEIMSSDSLTQCILNKHRTSSSSAGHANRTNPLANPVSQCLVLSNGSQMFIFQTIGGLLIVLTYLVNVDPRRVDVGFKSLSIGLSYFIAHVITIQSGGFYGNPLHLLALIQFSSSPSSSWSSWSASGAVWHSEWFVYLVAPMVAGLFGALSHEYIDFTSLRNKNRQLHLRRSFYSLDNLATSAASSGAHLTACPATIQIDNHLHTGSQSANCQPTVGKSSSSRGSSMSSSSCLSMGRVNSSSVLTLPMATSGGGASNTNVQQMIMIGGQNEAQETLEQQMQQQQPVSRKTTASSMLLSAGNSNASQRTNSTNCSSSSSPPSCSSSYLRQVKQEQQRLASRLNGVAGAPSSPGDACNRHRRNSGPQPNNKRAAPTSSVSTGGHQRRRSSDYLDSNFLISSSVGLPIVSLGSNLRGQPQVAATNCRPSGCPGSSPSSQFCTSRFM